MKNAELIEIHRMMMCVADVNEDTPTSGVTSDMVKQYILYHKTKK